MWEIRLTVMWEKRTYIRNKKIWREGTTGAIYIEERMAGARPKDYVKFIYSNVSYEFI